MSHKYRKKLVFCLQESHPLALAALLLINVILTYSAFVLSKVQWDSSSYYFFFLVERVEGWGYIPGVPLIISNMCVSFSEM